MTGGQRANLSAIPSWLVWGVAIVFVVGGLGSFGILDNNEGLYAEIPREMLASRDWRLWIVPHLNGLPYMEKPPLLYWLTALSFFLFGETEWPTRLVPALSSLSCVALLLSFGKKVGRLHAGRLAALMFISGVGVTAMSHVLMFDMLLTALLTAALMFAYRFVHECRSALLHWSYAFLALAVLAKGLIAIALFGIVVFAFTALCRQSSDDFRHTCTKWFNWRALLVFAAIAMPWHIAASLTEPIFAWFYFINEHVLRFLGKREPHDYYSGAWWYYYLPRMAIYLFPWSFLLLSLVASRQQYAGKKDVDMRRFLLLAWLLPLVFFSLSSAKANYYLVAVMPFATFHLALAIEDRDYLSPVQRALPGVVIALLAGILLVAVATHGTMSNKALVIMGMPQHTFVLVVLSGLLVLALLSAWCAWQIGHIGIVAYIALPIWISIALAAMLQAMEPLISTRQLSHYLQKELPNRTVYLFRNFEERSSLPFYLRHPVQVVDARSNDLFWSNCLHRNDIIISTERFAEEMARQPVAIVVIQRQLQDFRSLPFAARFKGEKRIGDTIVYHN